VRIMFDYRRMVAGLALLLPLIFVLFYDLLFSDARPCVFGDEQQLQKNMYLRTTKIAGY